MFNGSDFAVANTIEKRAANVGMSVEAYEAMLKQGWDDHFGENRRCFVSVPEAAGMPAPDSALDVHGDWMPDSHDEWRELNAGINR